MKKPSGVQTDGSAQSLVDVAAIDQLARIAVEIRSERDRDQPRRPAGASGARASPSSSERSRDSSNGVWPRPIAAQGSAVAPPAMDPPAADLAGAVKSPMVGTAYLRASPEAKPFVEIGSMVKVGDKLLLVEAMKTFNDIVAPRAGKVVRILVEDGSPIEYDQPLMIVE